MAKKDLRNNFLERMKSIPENQEVEKKVQEPKKTKRVAKSKAEVKAASDDKKDEQPSMDNILKKVVQEDHNDYVRIMNVRLKQSEYKKLQDKALELGYVRKARGEDQMTGDVSKLIKAMIKSL